jgi:membrane protein
MASTRPRESAVDRIRERVEEKAARRAAAAKAEAEPTRDDANRPPPGAPSERELPGIHAEKPTQIPWRGWKQIVKRA